VIARNSFFTYHKIFAHVADEGRIVVTFDLDFGETGGLAGATGATVVLLRLRLARQDYLRQRLQAAIVEAAEALVRISHTRQALGS